MSKYYLNFKAFLIFKLQIFKSDFQFCSDLISFFEYYKSWSLFCYLIKIMWFFSIFVFALVMLHTLRMPHYLTLFAMQSQQICRQMINQQNSSHEIIQAFVCGISLDDPTNKQIFLQTGLIHLLVVSGSHLIFVASVLEFLLQKSKIYFLISFSFLAGYSLMTGLQPPVLRALFSLFIHKASEHQRWNWSSLQILFFSGLCCLMIYPNWFFSHSLILSLLASLGITLIKKSSLLKSMMAFLCVSPCLWGWGQSHPACIFINWLLAPFVSIYLWFVSFFSFFLPRISDYLTEQLLYFLKQLSLWVPFYNFGTSLPIEHLWIYFCTLLLTMNFIYQRERRKNWHF
jgi:ComEC/Rec2-related protein